jgi:hypothetical protein
MELFLSGARWAVKAQFISVELYAAPWLVADRHPPGLLQNAENAAPAPIADVLLDSR